MKLLIASVLVLAAVFVNCLSAHALSFGGGSITVKACNPDTTPSDPLRCSIHEILHERGGSSPTAFELIVGTIDVPPGRAALVCTNGGGKTTFSPGLGGVTFISIVNGANVINNQNGNFFSEHRYLNHIRDFDGNVVAFRDYWKLPLDRTLCRSDQWTELMIIPSEIFATGAIYSHCTTINDPTSCELDATIQGTCTIVGKVTPTTPEWTYDCTNVVVNNNP